MLKRPTREQAFDDVVAQHLGYPSGVALRNKNSQVRKAKRLVNQVADHAFAEYQRGNMALADKLLTNPTGATAFINAASRSIFRK